MKTILKPILSFLLGLFISGCVQKTNINKDSTLENTIFSEFTKLVDFAAEDALEKGNATSFALAIYKDGEIYQNYYGKTTSKPDDNSLYEIASITKTFTGSLVAKAVVAGKINLDDDIRNYLDGDYSNLEFERHPITIKNLLTHSLGFKVKTPKRLEAFNVAMNSGKKLDEVDVYTVEDFLDELKTVEVDKKPGTAYVYNSVGPELLAYILEKVNEQPFKEQLDSFVKDIGMRNTYLQESEKHTEYLVKGYEGAELVPMGYCPVYGAAGGAISTLPDMATYMKYLVVNKETPWVKEASRLLFTDEEEDENIGYLWEEIGYGDEEGYFYSKTGTSNGIQSGVLICPDSDYGIVLMVNNTSEEAFNDWATLFFRDIEPGLIRFPKFNLTSVLKKEFKENPKSAFETFRKHKIDTVNYFYTLNELNVYGYELLHRKEEEEAIEVFKFLTEEFPMNANFYDSLGEVYFINGDLDNAALNYEKSLELDAANDNAKTYIEKIKEQKKLKNE